MRNLAASLVLATCLGVTASAQLTLPYSGTDPTATLSSFQITKSGTAGRANTLYMTNASNTSDVLLANTLGLGKGGFFQINNANNTNQALRGESNGRGIGVFGLMTGTGRGGVFRIINSASTNYALFAETDGSGPALKVNAGSGLAGDFVGAIRSVATGTAILGQSTGGSYGVNGKGYIGVLGEGTTYGLYGTGSYGAFVSGTTFGITAYGPTGAYGSGSNYGTFGVGGSVGAYGRGSNYGVQGVGATAVYGEGTYHGVKGQGPIGVYGVGTSGSNYGVSGSGTYYGGTYGYGPTIGTRGDSPYVGMWAQGGDYGLNAIASKTSGQNYGVFCQSMSPAGYALWVNGRSATTGTKSFVIDHPLDPANKVLNHFCTEAPEPLNAYSGNIVTDERGFATVHLPAYFESINKDFRYQLAVLDGGEDFVQVKVSKRIQGNQFTVRTNKASVEVSWRVEGVRNDRWVQQRGFKTEENKAQVNRGKYIEPELYGQPAEKGITYKNVTALKGTKPAERP